MSSKRSMPITAPVSAKRAAAKAAPEPKFSEDGIFAYWVDGDKLHVVADISAKRVAAAKPSGTGRTYKVAYTEQMLKISQEDGAPFPGMMIGLNVLQSTKARG